MELYYLSIKIGCYFSVNPKKYNNIFYKVNFILYFAFSISFIFVTLRFLGAFVVDFFLTPLSRINKL